MEPDIAQACTGVKSSVANPSLLIRVFRGMPDTNAVTRSF
jgi:hypothetical protein